MQKSAATKWGYKWLLLGAGALVVPFLLNGCVAAVAAGAGGAEVAQESRSMGTMIYDESVEQEASKILKSNSLLSNSKDHSVSPTCFNGNVLLTGQSTNKDYIKWAAKQIEQLAHVRKVYNYVTLQAPVSASVVSSDAFITSQVKSKLILGKGIDSTNIKVVTENGNVYLMGIVTHDGGTRATNEALKVKGVRNVYQIFDFVEPTQNQGKKNEKVVVTPVQEGSSVANATGQTRSNNLTNYGDSNSVVYNQYDYSSQNQGQSAVVSSPSSSAAANSRAASSLIEDVPVQEAVYTPPVPQEDSTYVPPVQNQQNGGAYIVEEL